MCVRACVRECVRPCVRACVRVCVCVCVSVGLSLCLCSNEKTEGAAKMTAAVTDSCPPSGALQASSARAKHGAGRVKISSVINEQRADQRAEQVSGGKYLQICHGVPPRPETGPPNSPP